MTRGLRKLATRVSAAAFAVALITPAASAQSPELRARADEVLKRFAAPHTPGVVVAVVDRGQVVYRNAVGVASLEQRTPLTPTTILDIGSVAKQFTAYAIALLESQGKLSLSDPIKKYLPEIPDIAAGVTIRHLLNHTSGLREIYNTMAIGGWQSGDGMTQEQALRLVAAQPALQFTPGSEHVYNNTGYMLLSDIVERVTGTQFHEWMQNNLFRPLGMERTVIMHRLGQVIPGSADSYSQSGDEYVRVFDNSTIQGAGGIYSTAEDMTRWLANWSNPVVGNAAVVKRMQERVVLTTGDTLNYALGVTIDRDRGLRRIQHGGSSAAFRTTLYYYPEHASGIIVQSNLASMNTAAIAAALANIFLGDRMQPLTLASSPAPPSREPSAAAAPWAPHAAELADYTGRFYSTEVEAMYHLLVKSDTLTLRHQRIGEQKMRPRQRDVFDVAGGIGEVRFLRDNTGRITGFTVSNGRTRGVQFQAMSRN